MATRPDLDRRLAPSRLAFEDWLAPGVAAVVAAAALWAAPPDPAALRGWVFVMGPLLWLTGLAPRLHPYLHAPERLRLLPLPLGGRAHWAACRAPHGRGLALTTLAGTVAIAVGCGPRLSPAVALGLVGDWLWLSMLVGLLEPWTPAAAAWLGRRFGQDGLAATVQARLSGGWTLPEATAHLYVPPLGLGAAAALAMPGQLLFDRVVDGAPVPTALVGVSIGGVLVAAILRPFAARPYAVAVFEAVPWLAQATRTLAGPPIPASVPRIILRTSDPALRLFALQLFRTTPVPMLRLWTLVGISAWFGLVAGLTPARAAVVVALAMAWIVPGLRVLVRGASSRASAFVGRPGPSLRRRARPPGAWAWLLGPVALAAFLSLLGSPLS